MRPLRRSNTNKRQSAATFRAKAGTTKAANINRVMRGGIRF